MLRRVLDLFILLSLLPFVAAAVLWVRSYFATDTLRIEDRTRVTRVVLFRGEAVVGSRDEPNNLWSASLKVGTDDVPWAPDYIWTGMDRYTHGLPEYAPPGGRDLFQPGGMDRWLAEPLQPRAPVPLAAVVALCAVPPAVLLVVRRVTRPGGWGSMPAAGVRARAARAVVTGSTAACVIALAAWIDNGTWHHWRLWCGGRLNCDVTSHAGIGSIGILMDWLPPGSVRHWPNALNFDDGRPQVMWSRDWLAPADRRGAQRERRWLSWFRGRVARDDALTPPGAVPTGPIVGFWVTIPYWFVVLTAAVAPSWSAARAWRGRRRHSAGHCPACGYDLRATPQRCPECGREYDGGRVPRPPLTCTQGRGMG